MNEKKEGKVGNAGRKENLQRLKKKNKKKKREGGTRREQRETGRRGRKKGGIHVLSDPPHSHFLSHSLRKREVLPVLRHSPLLGIVLVKDEIWKCCHLLGHLEGRSFYKG
jgi:hypothetical protein